ALRFGELCEMLAAIQSLLLTRDGEKNNRPRKFQLAQNSRTLQAHRRTTGIVVGARSKAGLVQRIAVSGVIVAGYQHDALRVFRVRAFENSMNIGEEGRRRSACTYRVLNGIALY